MQENALEIEDLEFGWGAGPSLLRVPALGIARGERVLLHGPSGSGKSTLLGLVGGVLAPRSGVIRVLGTDLTALGAARRDALRAAQVGFIFQLFNLVPYLSVLDNVLLPARFSSERAARCTEPLGEARRLLAALGLGGPDIERRRATELSVGQQQRVAAARALLGRPGLLVADEPTSALDADARGSFLALLMDECARGGTSVMFVTHDVGLGAAFDRSIALTALQGRRPPREAA